MHYDYSKSVVKDKTCFRWSVLRTFSKFETLHLLLEGPEVPDDDFSVAGRRRDLVHLALAAGSDLDARNLGEKIVEISTWNVGFLNGET